LQDYIPLGEKDYKGMKNETRKLIIIDTIDYLIINSAFLIRIKTYIKPRANAFNFVGQQDTTLLGPTCCKHLHNMLGVVATFG